MIKKIIMLLLCMSTTGAMDTSEAAKAKKDDSEWLRKVKVAYFPTLSLENEREELIAYGLYTALQRKSLGEYPTTFAKAFHFCEGPLVSYPSPDLRVRYICIIKRFSNAVMQMAYRNDLNESDFEQIVDNCINSICASCPLMNAIIGVDTQMTSAQIQQEFNHLAITVNNSTTTSEKIWHH